MPHGNHADSSTISMRRQSNALQRCVCVRREGPSAISSGKTTYTQQHTQHITHTQHTHMHTQISYTCKVLKLLEQALLTFSANRKFKFLRCKSCGRYITHAICSDNHLIESGECRDCVLASAHNTPQATPTSYAPTSGAGNKGKKKPTPTALKSTPAHALSTAMPTVTPSTSSNVGQMLTCSCAVCEAKRGTVHGLANVKGGGGTDHKDEGGMCGARQNLPNDMPRGGAALVQQRGTAYGGQEGGTHLTSGGQEGETQHGTVPTSRRKRCLEYPSDDLRPKMDKPSSSSPSSSSEHGALKPPCKSNSKITIATSLPPPRSTRSATSKVVPLPVSGASLSTRPSRLPGPPAVSSAPAPLPSSSSSSSSTSNPMETPFSRTLTYSQVMNTKATSCAKHGSNRMKV